MGDFTKAVSLRDWGANRNGSRWATAQESGRDRLPSAPRSRGAFGEARSVFQRKVFAACLAIGLDHDGGIRQVDLVVRRKEVVWLVQS